MRMVGWSVLLVAVVNGIILGQEPSAIFTAIDNYLSPEVTGGHHDLPNITCAGIVDDLGRPPLDYAIECCTDQTSGRINAGQLLPLALLLLQHGANVDAGDHDGICPIHMAVAAGSSESVSFLLEHHAQINAGDHKAQTPLMLALSSRSPNPDIVRMLLAAHAAIDGPPPSSSADPRGAPVESTPLALAISARLAALDDVHQGAPAVFGELIPSERAERALAIIDQLLTAGAKPDAMISGPSGFQWPVLFAVVRSGDLESSRLLISHGAHHDGTVDDGLSLMKLAVISGEASLVTYLAKLGLSAKDHDQQGTPLLCLQQKASVLAALLDAGADPNSRRRDRLTALHLAVDDDNSAAITVLLDHGAALDCTVESDQNTGTQIVGQTPLLRAIAGHHGAALLTLLRRGARLTARLSTGESALHLAAAWTGPLISDRANQPVDLPQDAPSLIHLIAAEGADIHALTLTNTQSKSPWGRNALHLACHAQIPENAEALLAIGVDAMEKDSAGCTPSRLAIANSVQRQHWITVFAQAGVPIDPDEIDQVDLLEAIASVNQQRVADLLAANPALVKDANIAGDDSDGGSALHMAIAAHHLPLETMLLDHGADPGSKDTRGREALHRAVETNQPDTIPLLLAHGADVNALTQGAAGLTPLGIALGQSTGNTNNANKLQRTAMVQLLLDSGAHANAATGNDRTPLQLAVISSNLVAVTALLDHGADVTVLDHDLHTLLHLLSWNSSDATAIAYLLVAKGLDPNQRDKPHGQTALHLVARNGNGHAISTLIGLGANASAVDDRGRTPLHLAAENGNLSAIETLLDAGVGTVATDVNHATALMTAAEAGQVDAVLHLLAHHADGAGIDIDAIRGWGLLKNSQHYKLQALLARDGRIANSRLMRGESLLMRAADRCDCIGLRLLLEHGASARAQDEAGRTVLMHAVLASGFDQVQVAATLLQAGADPNQVDQAGLTAAKLLESRIAAKQGNPAVNEQMLTLLRARESSAKADGQ